AKWYITPLCGLAFSLTIEATQMFCNGATDLDDLITNTIGTIIGYIIFALIKKISPKILNYTRNPDIVLKNHEAFFYFVIVMFTQLFLTSFIVKLLV
ncbi:MAG: VanZ family protein, partial [Oscillospiraceae bacterium]